MTGSARQAFGNPALTTDVIVGFPGETEEEFAETCDFLKKVNFYQTHIFRYSRRRGTVADRLPDQIPEKVKAERSAKLLALDRINRRAFAESFLGTGREVLLETMLEEKDGKTVWTGLTPEYLRLKLGLEEGQPGMIVPVVVNRENLMILEE